MLFQAINRQSSPNQFYKSLSLLPPNQPTERQQLPAQRAWEYNYGDKARSNTATVIGIFEPNREGKNPQLDIGVITLKILKWLLICFQTSAYLFINFSPLFCS